MLVYPNPASRQATVDLSGLTLEETEAAHDLVLFSTFGQIVWRQALPAGQLGIEQIALDKIPPGVYYISLRQNGAILATQRLVVGRN